jgi:hypothetical protein
MSGLILTILEFIGVYLFFLTGEFLLCILTFGKHSIKDTTIKFGAVGQLYFEVSYYLGIVFWIAVLVAVQKYAF